MGQNTKRFILFLFVSLVLGQTGWSQSDNNTFTLTSQGIGQVQLGVDPNELPESIPGLYASKSFSDPLAQYLSDDDDDDWGVFEGWEFLDDEGNTVFTAEVDSLGLICEITISSPDILTADGLHVGSTPHQVEKNKGAQKIMPGPWEDNGRVRYQLNGITLWIDDFLIDDGHSEERVAQITIPADDNEFNYFARDNQTIVKILNYYSSSSSLSQLERHIYEIRYLEGVEDVYSNGRTTLFVDLSGSGTLSFSFFPTVAAMPQASLNNILNGLKNSQKYPKDLNLNRYTITFQQENDKRFASQKGTLDIVDQMFKKCNMTGGFSEPTVEFFMNDIYNYDFIFLNTHGCYSPKTSHHYLLTSTTVAELTHNQFNEIKTKINNGETDITVLNRDVFNKYQNHWNSGSLTYGFVKEQRDTEVMVCYLQVSEDIFLSSDREFAHRGHAIIFNTACQSLMGVTTDGKKVQNYSLAEAFGNKGVGAYLGYDDSNHVGWYSGTEFFGRLFSGMSIKYAYESIDKEARHCTGTEEGISYDADLLMYCPYISNRFRIHPIEKQSDRSFQITSSIRKWVIHQEGQQTIEGLTRGSIKDTIEAEIPLHYFHYIPKDWDKSDLEENKNLDFIPIMYGFQFCKNKDFKDGETITFPTFLNHPVIAINEDDNSTAISLVCTYNDKEKTVTIKFIFDLPLTIFWDEEKQQCYRRPIVMDADNNINYGQYTHMYKRGGPSDPNRGGTKP